MAFWTIADRVAVLLGAGDAGVGGVDVVGGAEHRDFGQQAGPLVEQGTRPGGGGGRPARRGRGRGCCRRGR